MNPLQETGVRFDERRGGYYWCVELPGGRAAHGYSETLSEAQGIIAEYQHAATCEFRRRGPRSVWGLDGTSTGGERNGT